MVDGSEDLKDEGVELSVSNDSDSIVKNPDETEDDSSNGKGINNPDGIFVGEEPEFIENDSLVGKILEERYELLSLIGEGGIGAVYKAKHLHLEKFVAIKFLMPHLVGEQRALNRFKKEAEITCDLSHPNIVTVREYGVSDGRPFLVMDYLEGLSLRDSIDTIYDGNEKETLKKLLPILDALCYAHEKGIVHRDIKPANIIFEKNGDSSSPQILDFGIAKIVESEQFKEGITRTGEWFGTPFYMSPEQCHGSEISVASDIYSIGCVLYEIFEGKPPFTGKSALEIFMKHSSEKVPPFEGEDISDSLKQIICKCLEKNPVDRYQSVLELKNDLKAILDDQPILANQAKPSTFGRGAIVASVVASVILLSFMIFQFRDFYLLEQDEKLKTWQSYERKGLKLRRSGHRREGAELLVKAYELAKKEKVEAKTRLRILDEIASAYRGIPDFDKYKSTIKSYVNLAYQVDEVEEGEYMLMQLAWIEHDTGEFENAIKTLKILEKSWLASRGETHPGLIVLYQLVGTSFYKLNEMEKAEKVLLQCVGKYNELNMANYEDSAGFAYYYLSRIYEKKGDKESYKKYVKLARDSQKIILDYSRKTSILEKRFLNLKI